jgi:hypothetical protein
MPLPHNVVKNINCDIIRWVEGTKQETISGSVLDYIYFTGHGIASHGFSQDDLYKVFIKPDNTKSHVLLVKVA